MDRAFNVFVFAVRHDPQPRTWNATDHLSKRIIVKSWKLFFVFQETDGRTWQYAFKILKHAMSLTTESFGDV